MKIKVFKNYFTEIWLLFVFTIVISVSLLSLVLSSAFESNVIETVNNLNTESINEISRTNEYIRKMIRISGMELFFEPSIQQLMHGVDTNNYEVLTGLRRLDSVKSMEAHIHSIFVYNSNKDYIYATSNFRSEDIDAFADSGVAKLLFSEEEPMRLAPIPRYIQEEETSTPVHTFVYYDPMSFEGPVTGALIINISLQWLDEIIGTEETAGSVLYFINREGEVVYHPDKSRFMLDYSNRPYIRRILSSREESGYFVEEQKNGKQLFMYTESDGGNLFLVRSIPYELLIRRVTEMRTHTLKIMLVFLLMGILLAFFFSKRIYSPIRRLLSSIDLREYQAEKADIKNLTSTIENILSGASASNPDSEAFLVTLRKEVMKELLNGNVLSSAGVQSLFEEYGIKFSTDTPFQLLMCNGDITVEEIENIVPYSGERMVLDVGENIVVVFQNTHNSYKDSILEKARPLVEDSFIYSGWVKNADELPEKFSRMNELQKLSFLYSNKTVLSIEEEKRKEELFEYPTDIEKKLLQELKSERLTGAKKMYSLFLENINGYRYDNIRFSLKRLYVSIQLLIKEKQEQGYFINHRDFHINSFENLFSRLHNLETLNSFFHELFESFVQELQNKRLEKLHAIASEIEENVKNGYTDPGLCPDSIADSIGLSKSYISKVYKEVRSISISEYITNIRIEHAKSLLTKKQHHIKEIASQIGITNENYFYTVFRKKTGMTPKSFREYSSS